MFKKKLKDAVMIKDENGENKFLSLPALIQDWCNEVKKPCGYRLDRDKGIINVYTRYPGAYIGCQGKTKAKYASQLKLLGWSVYFYELYDVCEPGPSYSERMAKEFEGLSLDEI